MSLNFLKIILFIQDICCGHIQSETEILPSAIIAFHWNCPFGDSKLQSNYILLHRFEMKNGFS